ncbi:ATP-dependent 6-phosphofructokinase [Alphaproteobacteria bacterium]|nr:ATP-dependent 6-phosphofructokinase [Alphaproteobacteria bacterium]
MAIELKNRIGILTSGGDCSGLNSVIRSAYIRAKTLGYELVGIRRGMSGLAASNQDYVVLSESICDASLLTTSGSVLLSDTKWISNELKTTGKTPADIRKDVVEGYKKLDLGALICVGGDGSLSLFYELLVNEPEINFVIVPKTIDNDVANTDFSVGFHTAINVVADAVENIISTAKSHERTMVIEIMGRDAGYIAMYAGVATGADAILVPEFKCSIDGLRKKVKSVYDSGLNHCIVLVAESVSLDGFSHKDAFVDGVIKYSSTKYCGIGEYISAKLNEFGIESRSVTLGHVQRGGRTAVFDRLIASAFGISAVNCIHVGEFGKMLGFEHNTVKTIDVKSLNCNFNRKLPPSDLCLQIANMTNTYVGEV